MQKLVLASNNEDKLMFIEKPENAESYTLNASDNLTYDTIIDNNAMLALLIHTDKSETETSATITADVSPVLGVVVVTTAGLVVVGASAAVVSSSTSPIKPMYMFAKKFTTSLSSMPSIAVVSRPRLSRPAKIESAIEATASVAGADSLVESPATSAPSS